MLLTKVIVMIMKTKWWVFQTLYDQHTLFFLVFIAVFKLLSILSICDSLQHLHRMDHILSSAVVISFLASILLSESGVPLFLVFQFRSMFLIG